MRLQDASRNAVEIQRGDVDWQAVRELCCLTGAGGDAVPRERWPFFAEQWIGPYQKLLPEWTYVAIERQGTPVARSSIIERQGTPVVRSSKIERQGGQVLGYLTGCPDSSVFRIRRFLRSTVPLLFGVAFGRYSRDQGTQRFWRRAFGFEKSPEQRFSEETQESLSCFYPAHLHVNVSAEARGLGVGRMLVEFFLRDLRHAGVSGAHVFCGEKPVAFYESLGFSQVEVVGLPHCFALALALRTPPKELAAHAAGGDEMSIG